MVSTCGCAETVDVGSCIFACETYQGESCKRSTQHSSITSRNTHKSKKADGAGPDGGSVKPSIHRQMPSWVYETWPQRLSWAQIKLRFLMLVWFSHLVTLKGSFFWITTWIFLNIWHPKCVSGKSSPVYCRLQHEAHVVSFQPGSSKPWSLATSTYMETNQLIPVHIHPLQVIWRVLVYTSFLRPHTAIVNDHRIDILNR